VLRAAVQRGASEWWCLGDLVGYGADPLHTLRVCTEEATRCLAGNHDLGASGRIPLDVFSAHALAALTWTREALGPTGRAQLDRLRPVDAGGDVPLYHASPRDPVWEYILSVGQARDALERTGAPLLLVGHTHLPVAWHHGEDGAMRRVATDAGPIALTPGRWLVNPGSVGQPRDGDARASWALYDPGAATIEIVRTPYDVAGAQGAILAAGLPAGLATRLSGGR
jgi:diadenosine tetraphosphatase ApaH/serine/threonine PP2A family protein phosphatase